MSYILDALRKSETERRQGQVPDLGQQVQLIHRPKSKSVPSSLWVALALVLNAAVLAYVFWPTHSVGLVSGIENDSPEDAADTEAVAVEATEPEEPEPAPAVETVSKDEPPAVASEPVANPVPEPAAVSEVETNPEPEVAERPTVIVPSPNRSLAIAEPGMLEESGFRERVPHLVELPLSFQRQVPDLIFNSHIYASDPAARRVMINDHYLRIGDVFSGIRVDRITEEGVELSLNGRRFRVGVVRDWISPR